MSHFSDVDNSPAVARLATYLDHTDASLSAFKAYVVAAAARAVPGGVVLDVGCGVGHDLRRLAAAGLQPIGLDLSARFLESAAACGPVVQANGERLPFADASFDGVRVERTLQHVADPCAVLAEIARVVRPRGFLAVLEPDNTSARVDSDVAPDGFLLARHLRARHPGLGATTPRLVEESGFRVDDVVTEASTGYAFDDLPFDARMILGRAAEEGRVERALVDRWIAEQVARTANGTFRARWDKVLVVARKH